MIKNKTKKISLAKNYVECKNLFSQARGLMFNKKKNLIFIFKKEEKISLHMFFVFFPIWAIYLDKNKKVIFKKKLYPFVSIANPKLKTKYVIELIEEPKADIGDSITW